MYSSRTSLHHGHIRTKCISASVAFLQTDMLNLFACYYWLQSVVCVFNGKTPSLNPVRTFLALSPIFFMSFNQADKTSQFQCAVEEETIVSYQTGCPFLFV